MEQKSKLPLFGSIKRFFTKAFDNIDKKMEKEAKAKPCCCKPTEGKDKSCCS